jgi:hypothetical protein
VFIGPSFSYRVGCVRPTKFGRFGDVMQRADRGLPMIDSGVFTLHVLGEQLIDWQNKFCFRFHFNL